MGETKEVREKARNAVMSTTEFFFSKLEAAGVDDNAARLDAAVKLTDIVERWCMTYYIREAREGTKQEEKQEEKVEMATEKQKNFARRLGIKFPEDITKKALSLMIDTELKARGRR